MYKRQGEYSSTFDVGNTIKVCVDAIDPDGSGPISTYSWELSEDGESGWTSIGTSSSVKIPSNSVGKKIRAVIDYTDNEGNQQQVITTSKDILGSQSSTSNTGEDLNIFADFINTSLLTSSFRTSSTFTNFLDGKRFHYVLQTGGIDLSSFSDNQLTYDVNNLIYKGTPFDSTSWNSNVELEVVLNGQLTLQKNQVGLQDGDYDYLTANLSPTTTLYVDGASVSTTTQILETDNLNVSSDGTFQVDSCLLYTSPSPRD